MSVVMSVAISFVNFYHQVRRGCKLRFSALLLSMLLANAIAYLPVANASNVSPATRVSFTLTLEKAIYLAVSADPWLNQSQYREQASLAKGEAAMSFSDPVISLGVQNLPTDSWDFNQENMTQLRLGVSQPLPRKGERAIRKSQFDLTAGKQPLLRLDRSAQLKRQVSLLWLEAFRAQQVIQFIEADRALFEKLVDSSKASYGSVSGKVKQQDIIAAQLELLQLDDKLAAEQQKYLAALGALFEYLPSDVVGLEYLSIQLPSQLPLVEFSGRNIAKLARQKLTEQSLTGQVLGNNSHIQASLIQRFLTHPKIRVQGIDEKVAQQGVKLAKTQYQPKWQLNASYGYRDDADNRFINESNDGERADFFSVGVSVEVPLFTEKRQDNWLLAATAESEAIKTEQRLLLQKMLGETEKELANVAGLKKRQALYQSQILEQTLQQSKATLTAYTNANGSFTDVVRARIAELNAKVTALTIDVELLKAVSRLNYFFTTTTENTASE
ncbi:TolC family protein [Thalassotalea euphylliae]|uniref:TolC family protein n=1 Tax=Thalassotalea euphylliae TaxID=1655234 RepID=A0A3E0TRL7_9GAMM|nr:TolC family protein [Thalassotalea euphylliae]REL27266.1 TolC family protein [Thalassotalea euphylliae]